MPALEGSHHQQHLLQRTEKSSESFGGECFATILLLQITISQICFTLKKNPTSKPIPGLPRKSCFLFSRRNSSCDSALVFVMYDKSFVCLCLSLSCEILGGRRHSEFLNINVLLCGI